MSTEAKIYESNERTFSFNGIPVHYIEMGGGQPLLLLHGSGPGASTAGYWARVLKPLARSFHVHAMDLIGFGKSGRKLQEPYFDVQFWLEQCQAMIERLPAGPINLVGHSLSGALVLKLAARSKRIIRVVTTGTMGAAFSPSEAALRAWTFPRNIDELRLATQGLVFDASHIDDAYLQARMPTLLADGYESYFRAMFAGDKGQYIDAMRLSDEELAAVTCRVLMIHGRQDAFPAEALTLKIAQFLPDADVALLGRCAHSIAVEQPEKFIALVESFMRQPVPIRE